MATFRKRGDKWQVQIRRFGHRAISKSFQRRSDGDVWARQIESELERGVYIDRSVAESTLLSEILTRYGREISPSKACCQSDLIRLNHLNQRLGHLSLARLDSAHLAQYRDARLRLVSGQSVRSELMVLNRVLVIAQQEWRIQLPRGIPSVRKPKVPEGRTRRLETNEAEKLLSALNESPITQAAVQLAIETVNRPGFPGGSIP